MPLYIQTIEKNENEWERLGIYREEVGKAASLTQASESPTLSRE